MIYPQSKVHHRHMAGFSLVEVMVALVIGLIVVGAVLVNYLNASSGQRSGASQGQMAEDAGLALNILRRHIAMAGFSNPASINTTTQLFNRAYSGRAIFGCWNGFSNPTIGLITSLTCTGGGTDNGLDAVAVAYEADASNSLLDSSNKPRDVLGSSLVLNAAGTPPYLSEARFYVSDNALMAQGNGGGSTVPTATSTLPSGADRLVENIVAMRIWYGLSGTDGSGRPTRTAIRYTTAKDLNALVSDNIWNRVVTVRVCVVVRSEREILDAATPYYGCDAVTAATPATTTPGDRRLYRAYTTTILLPNRLGG